MDLIWKSFRRSFESMLSFKVLVLLFIPPFLSLLLWVLAFFGFWNHLLVSTESVTKTFLFFNFWQSVVSDFEFLSLVFHWIAIVFIILFAMPLIYLTSLLFTSVLIIPYLALKISKEDYPHLEKKKGGSLWGSFWNSIKATLVFLFWFFISLPLWIIPGLQIVIPVLLMASLNRKIFFYDSLQDFASVEERHEIAVTNNTPLFMLGIMNSFLNYIPFVFLLSPFLTTLSFLHYSLLSLERLRSLKGAGVT